MVFVRERVASGGRPKSTDFPCGGRPPSNFAWLAFIFLLKSGLKKSGALFSGVRELFLSASSLYMKRAIVP
uniref:Glutathione S-transferase 2 n=1 Tax=Streltzoviella insularis TaxID=1206366 RepID=A0A7D5UN06_9NEOP|nr:glutathione S-transferase 2 [Streltzoviella insularis]